MAEQKKVDGDGNGLLNIRVPAMVVYAALGLGTANAGWSVFGPERPKNLDVLELKIDQQRREINTLNKFKDKMMDEGPSHANKEIIADHEKLKDRVRVLEQKIK